MLEIELLPLTALTVYIVTRTLPDEIRPCYVTRRDDVTIVFADDRDSLSDALVWSAANLTIPERNYIRERIGQGPVGTLYDDETYNRNGGGDWLPDSLRPPKPAAARNIADAKTAAERRDGRTV